MKDFEEQLGIQNLHIRDNFSNSNFDISFTINNKVCGLSVSKEFLMDYYPSYEQQASEYDKMSMWKKYEIKISTISHCISDRKCFSYEKLFSILLRTKKTLKK